MSRDLAVRIAGLTLVLIICVSFAGASEKELHRTEQFPIVQGQSLVVEASSLKVSVRSADVVGAQVTTELRIAGVSNERGSDWVTRHTPEITSNDEGIAIRVAPGKSGFLGLGHLTARARLGIVMPGHSTPNITTSSGDIEVKGDFPMARPLHLRTATGHLDFMGATPELDIRSASGESRIVTIRPFERFFLRTSSGGINLVGGARHAIVDTASGNVWLENLSGSVEISTSTGKISLRWDRLDADATVKVQTSSGKVHLVIPDAVRPRGFLTTIAGTIRSDLPGVVNEAGDTVELHGDGPFFEVESASGEIVLESSVQRSSEPD
ncbi:MAG: DUF4097 domain-containing protein [bacterium]|nr:DUF4097 domain-containing protein [bacterium]